MKTNSIVSFKTQGHVSLGGRNWDESRSTPPCSANQKHGRLAKRAMLAVVVASAATTFGQLPTAHAVEYTGPIKTATMWDGSIYKFHRNPDTFNLVVRRADVPATAEGNTVWKVPLPGDFGNFGYFNNTGEFKSNTGGVRASDYPMAEAAPIVVNTGPREGVERSMSVLWLRWMGGDRFKDAPNRTAWTAITIDKYKKNNFETVSFDTYGAGMGAFGLKRDFAAQDPAFRMYEKTPQVGAAAIPGGNTVVTANPDANRSSVNINWWVFKPAKSWQVADGKREALSPLGNGGFAVKLPPGLNNQYWNGNVDLAVTQQPQANNNATNVTLWMTLRAGGNLFVGGARKTITDINKPLSLSELRSFNDFKWSVFPVANLNHSLMHVNVMGQAVINFSKFTGSYYDNPVPLSQIALPSTPGGAFGPIKTFGSIVPAGRSVPDAITTVGTPPVPATGENTLKKDIVVDVNEAYINADNDDSYRAIRVGYARRSQQITLNTALEKSPVLGFFDGPPPIPNENLREVPSTKLDSTLATVTYGNKTTSSTDTTLKGGVGPIIKVEGETGVPFVGSVEFEGEVSAMIGAGVTQTSESTRMTKNEQFAKVIKGNGEFARVVRPRGQVFLLQSSVVAYVYQLLDNNKNPLPDAPAYIQVQPSQLQVVAHDFVYNTKNPLTGIIPGSLPSYLVDEQGFQALEQNSALRPITINEAGERFPLSTSANHVFANWTTAGQTSGEFGAMNKTVTSTSIDIDGKLLAGGTAGDKKENNYISVKGGVQFKLSVDSQVGDSSEETLAIELSDVPYPDEDSDGAYDQYGFSTFMLKGDKAYQQELQTLLAYNDPDGINAGLRERIAWNNDNTPWKITYAILPGGFTQVHKAMELTFIPMSLQPLGIKDPTQLGLLASAVSQKANSARGPQASRSIKGVPANIVQIASKLTPAQQNDLAQYVSQNQAKAVTNFLKQYPNWKPRNILVGSSQPTSNGQNSMKTRSLMSVPKTVPAVSLDKITKVKP